LIDCQIMNPHLASLGVSEVSRSHFLRLLDRLDPNETRCGLWCL
jgi:Leu/Phe-tRNA-protein transferase